MAIITDGLLYYWHSFDGIKSGSVLNNIAPSGATHTMAVSGATVQTDGSLRMDGVDDTLTVTPTSFHSQFAQPFSVDIYLKSTIALQTVNALLMSGGVWAGRYDNTSRQLFSDFVYENEVYGSIGSSSTLMNTTNPVLLTITYNGSNNLSYYVNGTRIINFTLASRIAFSRTNYLNATFFSPNGTNKGWACDFYGIRLYNKVLSPAEIEQNRLNGVDIGINQPAVVDSSNLATFSSLSPENNAIITTTSQTISSVINDIDADINDVFLEVSRTQDFAVLSRNLNVTNIASGGIANFNLTGLSQGNYYWRMRAKKVGTSTYTSYTAIRGLFVDTTTNGRLSPDSIISMTGATGVLSSIQDDPDSPDGNFITTDGLSNTALLVSMPATPTLLTGANLQNFRVQVQKSASTTSTGSATISLYENGVSRTSQTFTLGTGNTSFVHQLSWDASLLTDVSGANVEVRVLGVGVYSGKGSDRFGVNIGAVEWNYQSISESQILAPTVDTTAPPNVTDIVSTNTSDSITLNWVNPIEDDFSHVKILRDDITMVDNLISNSYNDSGREPSTSYTYKIISVDTSSNESIGISVVVTTDGVATSFPLISSVTIDRNKISSVSGMDMTIVTFTFNQDVSEWTVNVMGADHLTGVIADSGLTVSAGVEIDAVIDWTELYQEGMNKVNIYGRNLEGIWTPYNDNYHIDGGNFTNTIFERTFGGQSFTSTQSERIITGREF